MIMTKVILFLVSAFCLNVVHSQSYGENFWNCDRQIVDI